MADGVPGCDVGDRLGEVVGRAVVGLAGEQCQELCPEAAGEPGRAVGTPGSKFGRHRGAIRLQVSACVPRCLFAARSGVRRPPDTACKLASSLPWIGGAPPC